MPGPGVRRQHGCWCRGEPSQHVKELLPGCSICTASLRPWRHENTAAQSPSTVGSWPTTRPSYLSRCTVSEKKPVTLSCESLKRRKIQFLTISVLENGGVFNESHIAVSCCQTPENDAFGFTKGSQIHRCDVINGLLKDTCCDGLHRT